MCLSIEWKYTHVEILTGNSWEKFINYRSFGRNRTYACAMPVHCSDPNVGSIPAGGPIVDEFFSTVPG